MFGSGNASMRSISSSSSSSSSGKKSAKPHPSNRPEESWLDTELSSVNPRLYRYVLDLQISNDSLVASNTDLLATIARHTEHIARLEKQIIALTAQPVHTFDGAGSVSEAYHPSISYHISEKSLTVLKPFKPLPENVIQDHDLMITRLYHQTNDMFVECQRALNRNCRDAESIRAEEIRDPVNNNHIVLDVARLYALVNSLTTYIDLLAPFNSKEWMCKHQAPVYPPRPAASVIHRSSMTHAMASRGQSPASSSVAHSRGHSPVRSTIDGIGLGSVLDPPSDASEALRSHQCVIYQLCKTKVAELFKLVAIPIHNPEDSSPDLQSHSSTLDPSDDYDVPVPFPSKPLKTQSTANIVGNGGTGTPKGHATNVLDTIPISTRGPDINRASPQLTVAIPRPSSAPIQSNPNRGLQQRKVSRGNINSSSSYRAPAIVHGIKVSAKLAQYVPNNTAGRGTQGGSKSRTALPTTRNGKGMSNEARLRQPSGAGQHYFQSSLPQAMVPKTIKVVYKPMY